MDEQDGPILKPIQPAGELTTEATKTPAKKKTTAPRQLHVMLLSDQFEVRGSSAQTIILAENLMDYGIRSTIVTPSINLVAPERRQFLKVKEYRYLTTPFVSRMMVHFVHQDFAEDRPDLIHIQSRQMLTQGIRLARKFDCPYVLTVHDYLALGEILHFDRPLNHNVLAVSGDVKAKLLTQPAITGENVKIVHSGVQHVSDQLIGQVLSGERTPVIGTAGPLEAIKGNAYFLQAAQIVLRSFPQVEFVVAGSGPEERQLRQLVRLLEISQHVTFVSNLYGFREPLRAMDIFCLPSLQQGLGTIMLEAMAWGRPVIASHVGGISSAIEDRKTGLLVPPKNPQILAERMLELLQNPLLAREIGQAGKVHVRKNFRIDQTVRLVADTYRAVYADWQSQKENR